MSLTVSACPFCDYDDAEIGEVSISEFAVDCPECRCIGPICGDVMEAIARWNHAPRRGDVGAVPVPKVPDWIANLDKRADAVREQFNRESA